ncbi:MAG: response regulator [Nanoarchaeota archaeon]
MAKTILIIDDDINDTETMKLVLEKEKYKILTADNGADALDCIKDNRPDAILLDIKMPTLSGYDLLRLLRERLNHKVKMIYVSIIPKCDVDLRDIDGFVQKPFMPANLIKEVKKALK